MQMSRKAEMDTLECQVRMTFATGVKNAALNLSEVPWELDATFPKSCPARSLSLRCHPPPFPLSTSSSSFPLRLSRNIHTHISGLWRPPWHLKSLSQTSSLWGNISADVSGGVQAPAWGWWKGSGNHRNGKSLGEEALIIVLWKSWPPGSNPGITWSKGHGPSLQGHFGNEVELWGQIFLNGFWWIPVPKRPEF